MIMRCLLLQNSLHDHQEIQTAVDCAQCVIRKDGASDFSGNEHGEEQQRQTEAGPTQLRPASRRRRAVVKGVRHHAPTRRRTTSSLGCTLITFTLLGCEGPSMPASLSSLVRYPTMCVRAVRSSKSPFFANALMPFSSARQISSFSKARYGWFRLMASCSCSSVRQATTECRQSVSHEFLRRESPRRPSDPCEGDPAARCRRLDRETLAIRVIEPILPQNQEESCPTLNRSQ